MKTSVLILMTRSKICLSEIISVIMKDKEKHSLKWRRSDTYRQGSPSGRKRARPVQNTKQINVYKLQYMFFYIPGIPVKRMCLRGTVGIAIAVFYTCIQRFEVLWTDWVECSVGVAIVILQESSTAGSLTHSCKKIKKNRARGLIILKLKWMSHCLLQL